MDKHQFQRQIGNQIQEQFGDKIKHQILRQVRGQLWDLKLTQYRYHSWCQIKDDLNG